MGHRYSAFDLRLTLDELQDRAGNDLNLQDVAHDLSERIDQLRECLQRDWAVRVLDAQLRLMPNGCSWDTTSAEDGYLVIFADVEGAAINGPWDRALDSDALTEEVARQSAASFIYPTLSAEEQARIGACP